jgi:NAD(P)-dependent dehydrogenase (short-subunit alcohol dehydrogenase family)
MKINGSVAVVTGAASGMGEAVTRRLARDGAKVAAWDLNGEGARRVAESVRSDGGSAEGYQVDVASLERVREAVERVAKDLGQPSILVNCAGATHRAGLLETRIEDWRRVMSVNLDGPFHTMVEVGRRMAAGGGGAIVNISSTAGLVGFPNRPAYIASKTGLVGLTRAAALDLVDKGIRVNAIAPGPIDTPMLRQYFTAPGAKEEMEAHTPMHRIGSPDEIADLVAYLVGEESSFITGQVIACDGGLVING